MRTKWMDPGEEMICMETWLERVCSALDSLADLPLESRVEAINRIRAKIHEHSPFSSEPVDCVRWVPGEIVEGNPYNPNSVAPPEMVLLEHSITADGYTQPIVAWEREEGYEVVDGFHRHRVGKESPAVRERVKGYLPLVVINQDRADKGDRIAATIRHNRARGKHRIDAMSEIVLDLKRRNWSDAKIGRELGMDPDEVLRLAQVAGLAEIFSNTEFSAAWEAVNTTDDQAAEDDEPLELDWLSDGASQQREAGWHDRSEISSILYGEQGQHLGLVQKSRFKNDEWFWYAYTAPIREGRAASKDAAKAQVVLVCAERP